jgi:hypothetical protein
VLPIALTGLALFPFLNNAAIAGSFIRLLQLGNGQSRQALPAGARFRRGDFYSGIVLLSPTKPVKQLMVPPKAAKSTFRNNLTKPLEIEFDGVYWYFQPPDERPHSDAPIVHGNPTRDTIHSTDHEPVIMVANQALNQSVAVTCCRALRVEIISGEGSLGPIDLEIILKNTAALKGARRAPGLDRSTPG